MKQWYDKDEDILNIEISSGEYWKSIELPNGVNIDVDKAGKIKGIEILNASDIFSGDIKFIIDNLSK